MIRSWNGALLFTQKFGHFGDAHDLSVHDPLEYMPGESAGSEGF